MLHFIPQTNCTITRQSAYIISYSGMHHSPAALRIESSRMSWKSPPASHIAKPAKPEDLMNAPFCANDLALSKDTMTSDVEL
jgi:hypothetical protein